MAKRPGGEVAFRPLHFTWLCDCSGSMSLDGKIQSLNQAIRESLPSMKKVADENPEASVFVHSLKFSHGADWLTPEPIPLNVFKWDDLKADPLQKPSVDIIFMLDTSGSMGNEIEGVKRSCVSFADQIVQKGANVRLGLVGFDIGGHRGRAGEEYQVYNLSTYTIGIWPLTSPQEFKKNVQSLSIGLFGGGGCYLANRDTLDIFPHICKAFTAPKENARVLVIISDEIGSSEGMPNIVEQLKKNSITAHVMGVAGNSGAHESIAKLTGGSFWDISRLQGVNDFNGLLDNVADTIAREVTQNLADGSVSSGTDMGTALRMTAEQLKMPPMPEKALPPVLVLISDGQPTDDFDAGLKYLMEQPWGKKSVRIAIGIGKDADMHVLQRFIGNVERKPLLAHNAESLAAYIRWVSTVVLKTASSPPSQVSGGQHTENVAIPQPPMVNEGENYPGVW